MPQDVVGHAADEGVAQLAFSRLAHDDQVGLFRFGRLQDFLRRGALGDDGLLEADAFLFSGVLELRLGVLLDLFGPEDQLLDERRIFIVERQT